MIPITIEHNVVCRADTVSVVGTHPRCVTLTGVKSVVAMLIQGPVSVGFPGSNYQKCDF